jgi:hypothetical protein
MHEQKSTTRHVICWLGIHLRDKKTPVAMIGQALL